MQTLETSFLLDFENITFFPFPYQLRTEKLAHLKERVL
jgi:hypothetical protein